MHLQHATRRPGKGRREGSALIIVMLMVFSLMVLGLTVSQGSLSRSRAATEEVGAMSALWAAEAGIGMKLLELEDTNGANTDSATYTLPDGSTCTVACTTAGEYLQLTADGVVNPGRVDPTTGLSLEVRRSVEVYVKPQFHPLFYKATYVGNEQNLPGYQVTFGPNVDGKDGGGTYKEGTATTTSWYGRNTVMVEADHQVDFNGDGDLTDRPTIGDIHGNRADWGWEGFVKSSGSNRALDINRDGDYKDSVTAPVVTYSPSTRDPSKDVPAPTPETHPKWAEMMKSDDGDYIDGDVYVNGDARLNGGTNVFGDVDATGVVTGDPVTGTAGDGTDYLAPPDLAAMNYDAIADEIVTSDKFGYIRKQQDPAYYGAALGPTTAHTNPYYHLQNGASSTLSFGESRDGTLIVIKGNLWIHDTSDTIIDMPKGSDERVTIVVEGNLYIADDLEYSNDVAADGSESSKKGPGNAILFIVKGNDANAESYVDANRNYKYDEGETLMHDDGDGKYEGPIEGQGNVYFGDPRFGTGGATDGYIYAQNNVYLVNPPMTAAAPAAQDQVFGVHGFLSAGGIMDLGDRGGGATYNNLRVHYDPRIENGDISFKGMPSALGGGWQGLAIVSWREIQ